MISHWSRVNNLILKIRTSSLCKLHQSYNDSTKVVYPLKNRSLVKVSGPQAAQFLQSLITNDMNHFKAGVQSMYAMFLNNKGRVLFDTLVHKWGRETCNTFMLECDKGVQTLLQRHLKIYKLKGDIKVENVSNKYKLWALIAPPDFNKYVCKTVTEHDINVYEDPRLVDLGHRLITTPDMGQVDIRQALGNDIVIRNNEKEYQALRYRLGVSEGSEDLFPDTCFPLEANCDYLHGLSFDKCWYMGQELTASTHQAGVTKRIMPIRFKNSEIEKKEDIQKDAKIWANRDCGKTDVGTLKNLVGSFGIGLLKVNEALEAKTLHIGSNPIEIMKPHWWPETRETIKTK